MRTDASAISHPFAPAHLSEASPPRPAAPRGLPFQPHKARRRIQGIPDPLVHLAHQPAAHLPRRLPPRGSLLAKRKIIRTEPTVILARLGPMPVDLGRALLGREPEGAPLLAEGPRMGQLADLAEGGPTVVLRAEGAGGGLRASRPATSTRARNLEREVDRTWRPPACPRTRWGDEGRPDSMRQVGPVRAARAAGGGSAGAEGRVALRAHNGLNLGRGCRGAHGSRVGGNTRPGPPCQGPLGPARHRAISPTLAASRRSLPMIRQPAQTAPTVYARNRHTSAWRAPLPQDPIINMLGSTLRVAGLRISTR